MSRLSVFLVLIASFIVLTEADTKLNGTSGGFMPGPEVPIFVRVKRVSSSFHGMDAPFRTRKSKNVSLYGASVCLNPPSRRSSPRSCATSSRGCFPLGLLGTLSSAHSTSPREPSLRCFCNYYNSTRAASRTSFLRSSRRRSTATRSTR
jgi:hypothetical protein